MHRRAASRATVVAALLMAAGFLGSSCARSVTLGTEEAVEILVLDGLDRARAACIVSALDDELDLAKVTGLDVDLDDDELALLAATSSNCARAMADTPGVVAGSSPDPSALEGEPGDPAFDIDAAVNRLVEEGLDPGFADCIILRLRGSTDPEALFDDDVGFSEVVVDCRDQGQDR